MADRELLHDHEAGFLDLDRAVRLRRYGQGDGAAVAELQAQLRQLGSIEQPIDLGPADPSLLLSVMVHETLRAELEEHPPESKGTPDVDPYAIDLFG